MVNQAEAASCRVSNGRPELREGRAEQPHVGAGEELPDHADDVVGNEQRQGDQHQHEADRPAALRNAERHRDAERDLDREDQEGEHQVAHQRALEARAGLGRGIEQVLEPAGAVPEEIVLPHRVLNRIVHDRHHRQQRREQDEAQDRHEEEPGPIVPDARVDHGRRSAAASIVGRRSPSPLGGEGGLRQGARRMRGWNTCRGRATLIPRCGTFSRGRGVPARGPDCALMPRAPGSGLRRGGRRRRCACGQGRGGRALRCLRCSAVGHRRDKRLVAERHVGEALAAEIVDAADLHGQAVGRKRRIVRAGCRA